MANSPRQPECHNNDNRPQQHIDSGVDWSRSEELNRRNFVLFDQQVLAAVRDQRVDFRYPDMKETKIEFNFRSLKPETSFSSKQMCCHLTRHNTGILLLQRLMLAVAEERKGSGTRLGRNMTIPCRMRQPVSNGGGGCTARSYLPWAK
jgi:hypothetical protein